VRHFAVAPKMANICSKVSTEELNQNFQNRFLESSPGSCCDIFSFTGVCFWFQKGEALAVAPKMAMIGSKDSVEELNQNFKIVFWKVVQGPVMIFFLLLGCVSDSKKVRHFAVAPKIAMICSKVSVEELNKKFQNRFLES
jgi:hypothetical protein